MERFHPTKLKFSGDPGGASLLQLATIPAESIPLILSLLPPWTVTLETPTLTLNLERQGVWKSCRTQGGKMQEIAWPLFFSGTAAESPWRPWNSESLWWRAQRIPWSEGVWFRQVGLLPTWGWGHPRCSQRLQLCLFHSGSYQRFIFMNSEHFL